MNSTNQLNASVHGHEVIHLIRDARPALSRDELQRVVRERFGVEARFHTCSAGAMSLEQLLQFLMSREKIVERAGRLEAVMDNVCSDGR